MSAAELLGLAHLWRIDYTGSLKIARSPAARTVLVYTPLASDVYYHSRPDFCNSRHNPSGSSVNRLRRMHNPLLMSLWAVGRWRMTPILDAQSSSSDLICELLHFRHTHNERQVCLLPWEHPTKILIGVCDPRNNGYKRGRSQERARLVPPHSRLPTTVPQIQLFVELAPHPLPRMIQLTLSPAMGTNRTMSTNIDEIHHLPAAPPRLSQLAAFVFLSSFSSSWSKLGLSSFSTICHPNLMNTAEPRLGCANSKVR